MNNGTKSNKPLRRSLKMNIMSEKLIGLIVLQNTTPPLVDLSKISCKKRRDTMYNIGNIYNEYDRIHALKNQNYLILKMSFIKFKLDLFKIVNLSLVKLDPNINAEDIS